ncbi:MAG: D-alanine--D-alanine ligase [Armatimonadetes bacterium CG_4_10_14_3_um_filter_66_18]|nr:MAG: D-alanine--D-alanine ligase [Armatimonadetes bacterium CG06_land_8_20_14_3_00_66_21]PIY48549.1 MAG: D-alanine--D-alanine ligase [Armatimonadetes bacterium CG_4_10_14_3_um_filter_66_18]PIZ31043.1 MAG: D-alanine--D-alanine ligase [Armatimonadetes bacterium CG_4_10_14_0_8_um_filter_66_14]PJB74060.1 MAG: D-alanine--D-alanine ligase [Armatimonadetes bacterium CG_4_9_14_3_um_filter_66_14]
MRRTAPRPQQVRTSRQRDRAHSREAPPSEHRMQPTSKLNVAVLMGGKTAEHEISLQTGVEIANALNKEHYRVFPLVITKQGHWIWPGQALTGAEERLSLPDVMHAAPPAPSATDAAPAGTPRRSALERLHPAPDRPVDVVFIAMHGPNGEDGTVQGLLELLDVPYTGSGVMASALAMDKPLAKLLFEQAGLRVPRGAVVDARRWREAPEACAAALVAAPGYPCLVKPTGQGSSVGASICRDAADLPHAMDLAFQFEPRVLVEEYLRGTELTCGVLEDPETREPVPLPVIEIVPKTTFFDYEAKYDPTITDEIVPARLPADVTARAQECARLAHVTLGCSAFSRTDMILQDGELYVMELNTIPGMTPNSLLPKAVRAAGMSFEALLDRLVQLAVNDHDLRHWQNGR